LKPLEVPEKKWGRIGCAIMGRRAIGRKKKVRGEKQEKQGGRVLGSLRGTYWPCYTSKNVR